MTGHGKRKKVMPLVGSTYRPSHVDVWMPKNVARRCLEDIRKFNDTVVNSPFAYWHDLNRDLWLVIWESMWITESICKLLVEDEKEGDTIGQNMDTTGKR